MPWVIGIDEAGYGPNLGPLVQAAVRLKLPDSDSSGWDTYTPLVRRCHNRNDGRLLIDDSKKVHARGGIAALERSLGVIQAEANGTVTAILSAILVDPGIGELLSDPWFDPDQCLPLEIDTEEMSRALAVRGSFAEPPTIRLAIVPPSRFNRICETNGSKGAVLALGCIALLKASVHSIMDNEPVIVICDKHGGRNFYSAMVQEAFPEGWVIVDCESSAESCYRVDGLQRSITIRFRPRADVNNMVVALASMQAKYWREVFMRQFNRFWSKYVPNLTPTAGYPVDAARYFAAIREMMNTLAIEAKQVWRNH